MDDKVLKEFYQYCLTTCSPSRLGKIKNVMFHVQEVLKKDLDKLDVNDVVKFLAYVNQSNLAQWTKNDFKKIFKRFVKWKYQDLEMIEGEKVKNGFKGVSMKKAFNKEKRNIKTNR